MSRVLEELRRTLLAGVLWVVAWLMSCGVIKAQETPPKDLGPAIGWTACDPTTGPQSWIRVDLLDTPAEIEVVGHEAMHRQQMGRFPTCTAFQARYAADPAFALEAEAEAYAYGYQMATAAGFPLDRATAFTAYLRLLQMTFPALPAADAITALHRYLP